MASVDATPGRLAVFGDVGGQAHELHAALVELGAHPEDLLLPGDLTVVQLGDLIHRGPDTAGAVAIVRNAMARQPERWVQLAGNHEAYYLTPPKFHWPERLAERDLETVYQWWRTRRMRVAAAVEVVGQPHQYLITHAGLTEGFWRHFIGMPTSAADAAVALNGLIGQIHESWLFRPGVMLTREVDLAAGPVWASAPDELVPSWAASVAPAPFHQIHGHSSTIDWATGRRYGRQDLPVACTEDEVLRHATVLIEGMAIVGIDPGHGRRPAPTWGPFVLHDARLVGLAPKPAPAVIGAHALFRRGEVTNGEPVARLQP